MRIRGTVLILAVLSLTPLLVSIPAAMAGSGENPAPYATTWKPTQVDVYFDKISDTNKYVVEDFGWTTPFSLSRVDCPRTSCGDSMYEHEMRFRQLGGETDYHYCENDWTPWSQVTNLPSGYWYDNTGIDNDDLSDEFTWGFHSEEAVEDTEYRIAYHCRPVANVTESNSFAYEGQIGHCHHWPPTGCGENTAFGDRTVTYIPRHLSTVNGYTSVPVTFAGNPGFEQGQAPWSLVNETSGSGVVCSNPNPLQGCCYTFLRPLDSSERVRMRFVWDVGSQHIAEEGDVYSEFWVRCPTAWNGSDCAVRASVEPLNNSNTPVGSPWYSGWVTIGRSDTTWYGFTLANNGGGFPSGTKKWEFLLEVSLNHSVDVDIHQQFNDRPDPAPH